MTSPFSRPRTIAALTLIFTFIGLRAGVKPAWAQTSTDAAKPRKVIALRAAHLVTAKSVASGEAEAAPIANAVVIIEGNRIKTVGSNLAVPPGAEVIDLGEMTLLPGLIDAHTHLLSDADSNDDAILRMVAGMSTAERALLGAKLGREDLEAGITMVRDLGNSGVNGDVALRDAIDRGWVIGPRIIASTRAFAPPGGQFGRIQLAAQNIIEQEYATMDGAQSARQAVRQALYDGANCIKVIMNGSSNITAEEIKAIVEQAHTSHLKVAAHATDEESVRLAVDAGVDSIEHGYTISDETMKLMAQKHIFLVPTDWPVREYLAQNFAGRNPSAAERAKATSDYQQFADANRDRLKRAISFGVPIAAGSDMFFAVPGQTRGQASLTMVEAYAYSGMTPMQIVHALTSGPAELLGEQKNAGTIEPGKYADFIAVTGDPLKDATELEHAKFVMKGGAVVKNEK